MPLTVVSNQGAAPTPQVVAPQVVVQHSGQALALAYSPTISIDQRALSFRQRRGPAGSSSSSIPGP